METYEYLLLLWMISIIFSLFLYFDIKKMEKNISKEEMFCDTLPKVIMLSPIINCLITIQWFNSRKDYKRYLLLKQESD